MILNKIIFSQIKAHHYVEMAGFGNKLTFKSTNPECLDEDNLINYEP